MREPEKRADSAFIAAVEARKFENSLLGDVH